MKSMALLLLCFSLAACGQIHYSPFATSNDKPELIEEQLSRLASVEESTNYPFKVAFISDTHNDYKEFGKFIDYINNHKGEYSMVIHCGDITTFGVEREYTTAKKLLNKLKVPYFVLPGNHDLISNGPTLFKNYFGAKDYTFSFKDVRFVLFSNNNFEDPGAPRLSWIDDVALNSSESLKVFATHIPPIVSERFSKGEVDEFKQIVEDEGVEYVASGHLHKSGSFTDYGASSRHLDSGKVTSSRNFTVLTFDGVGISESIVSF